MLNCVFLFDLRPLCAIQTDSPTDCTINVPVCVIWAILLLDLMFTNKDSYPRSKSLGILFWRYSPKALVNSADKFIVGVAVAFRLKMLLKCYEPTQIYPEKVHALVSLYLNMQSKKTMTPFSCRQSGCKTHEQITFITWINKSSIVCNFK